MPLMVHEVAVRLGGRIAGVMRTIPGHPMRLGAVEWRGASLFPPDQKWRAREEKILRPHLKRLLKKEKNDDKNTN